MSGKISYKRVVSSPGGGGALSASLTDTHIFVGDATNMAADVALTLSGTGGAFSLANTGVLTMPNADASTRGLITSTDWNTFNNKQDALTFSTGLTNTADTITNDLSTGVAGGQYMYGGTAASELLTIVSTTHATKGTVAFGATQVTGYNEIYDSWGIGVLGSSVKLSVLNTTEQIRVSYDGSNYFSTTVGGTGIVTFDAIGSAAQFVFNDSVSIGVGTASDKLHVYSSADSAQGIRIENPSATTAAYASLKLYSSEGSLSTLFKNSATNTLYGGAGSLNLFDFGDNSLGFGTNGTLRAIIAKTTGNLGVNTTNANGKVTINGAGNTDATFGLIVRDSASSPLFYIYDSGKINMSALPTSSAGLASGDIWNNSGVINIV